MIIFWDNYGTIVGSSHPLDNNVNDVEILPGVAEAMQKAEANIIVSGFKSPESEAQDYDPDALLVKFQSLMTKLPIDMVAFAPMRRGVACYVIIKGEGGNKIIKAHEDAVYKQYIGRFKKPDTGMFHVVHNMLEHELGRNISTNEMMMIGDTSHDQEAASKFGINFTSSSAVHDGSFVIPKW